MTQGTTKGVPIDTDPTLAANSNQLVCSQAAIKTYVDVTISGAALPVTATENQVLLSNNLAAPEWSTATYPPTAGVVGNLLTSDGTNWLSSTPAATNAAAVTKAITQAAHGFVVGDLLYLVGIVYTKAIATSAATSEVVGMVSAVAGANDFTLTTSGRVTGIPVTVAGTTYFLSPTTAGLYTATEPSTITQVSKPVLIADTTASGYLVNMRGNVIGSTSGALTATSLTFSPTTGGIVGTTTNDNADAGKVGEFVSSIIASASSVSCTVNTATNITSISLTAGDWDVWGNVNQTSVPTNPTQFLGWVSSASAALPDSSLYNNLSMSVALLSTSAGISVPQRRFSLSGTTTVYLSAYQVGSGGGPGSVCGAIYARRVR